VNEPRAALISSALWLSTYARPAAIGEFIELAEVVRGIKIRLSPVEAEPLHSLLDGVDVLLFLLFRVGVVEAQVAAAAVLLGEAEVEADRLDVAEMQVAVRLGRKARAHPGVGAGGQVGIHYLPNKVRAGGGAIHRKRLKFHEVYQCASMTRHGIDRSY
jgi:hypothetical protein